MPLAKLGDADCREDVTALVFLTPEYVDFIENQALKLDELFFQPLRVSGSGEGGPSSCFF